MGGRRAHAGDRTAFSYGALAGVWPGPHPHHPPVTLRGRSNFPQRMDEKADEQEALDPAQDSQSTSRRARISSQGVLSSLPLPNPAPRGLPTTSCLTSLSTVFYSSSSAMVSFTGCPQKQLGFPVLCGHPPQASQQVLSIPWQDQEPGFPSQGLGGSQLCALSAPSLHISRGNWSQVIP